MPEFFLNSIKILEKIFAFKRFENPKEPLKRKFKQLYALQEMFGD